MYMGPLIGDKTIIIIEHQSNTHTTLKLPHLKLMQHVRCSTLLLAKVSRQFETKYLLFLRSN